MDGSGLSSYQPDRPRIRIAHTGEGKGSWVALHTRIIRSSKIGARLARLFDPTDTLFGGDWARGHARPKPGDAYRSLRPPIALTTGCPQSRTQMHATRPASSHHTSQVQVRNAAGGIPRRPRSAGPLPWLLRSQLFVSGVTLVYFEHATGAQAARWGTRAHDLHMNNAQTVGNLELEP